MKVIALSLLLLCNTLSASAKVVCEDDDTLIPNPDDCSSFYNCDNGIPILTLCPPTLHFNPEALVCDRPENVDCTANPTTSTERATTTTTAKPTTTTTTAKPTTTTEKATTTTTTEQTTTTTEQTTTTTEEPTTTEQATTTTTETPTSTTTTEQPTTTTTEGSTSTSEQPPQSTCPPTGSDVIPNPNDCSSFLVCIDGHNTTVSCPNGMLYNDDIKTCDKAENVECNVKTTSEAPETTTTTTEKQTTTTTTETPTTTSTTQQSTSTTENVTSTTEQSTTTTEQSTSTTEEVTSTTEISTSTTDEVTSTTEQTTTSSSTTEQPGYQPECPEEGFAILENPESCSSFYVCVNGNFGLVQCPPDLDYNPATIRCDLPANPQCRAGTTLPPPPYVPPCPENGTVQLPDPSDCGSFYICINGNYAQLSCPDDFEFNVTSQSCVHPQQSTCNAMKTYELSFVCEGDGTFPDPEDCSKYYVCVGNQINHMECPGGLHFDVSLSTCNTPDEAQCELETTSNPTTETTTEVTTPTVTETTTNDDTTTEVPTTTTTTPKPTTDGTGNEPNCPDEGSAILPNPDNCYQFFICIEGSYDVVDCPEGYAFNEELGRCDLAENVDCNAGTPAPNQPDCPSEGSAKLPNPEDCGSYFFCLNGESALIECPDGLNYDADKETCSATATCSNESSTSSTSTTKNSDEPTDPDETTSTTTTEKPTDKPSECSEEGKLEPNPDDCTSFFQCANGVLVKLECPPGLEFNAESLVCDLPSLANCSQSKKVKSLFSFLKFWNKF